MDLKHRNVAGLFVVFAVQVSPCVGSMSCRMAYQAEHFHLTIPDRLPLECFVNVFSFKPNSTALVHLGNRNLKRG